MFYEPKEKATYFRFETGSFKFRKAVIAIIAINRLKKKSRLDHNKISQTVGHLFK